MQTLLAPEAVMNASFAYAAQATGGVGRRGPIAEPLHAEEA